MVNLFLPWNILGENSGSMTKIINSAEKYYLLLTFRKPLEIDYIVSKYVSRD
jgi:hypothetical protein